MPLSLPPVVLAGMGLPPLPADDGSAALPAPPPMLPPDPGGGGGGLHPAVAQALGLQPPASFAPPPGTPEPPPITPPLTLPSARPPEPPPNTNPPRNQDFTVDGRTGAPVPPSAPKSAPVAKPAAPSRLPGPDQQFAAASGAQDAATADAQRANINATSSAAVEADSQVANYTQHDADAQRIQGELKAAQDDYLKTHAEKQGIVDSLYKQADNYKIDQNKYWKDAGVGSHVGWYVAMALGGLGNAFLGVNNPGQGAAENPAIKALQAKMKESVEMQIDQRSQLKERGARAEHQLDKYDAFSKDRQAIISGRLGELDHVLAQNVMATAAKYKSANVMAAGQKIAADLEQQSAEKKQAAAQFAATYDTQKRQIGATYAGQAQAERHFQAQMGMEQQKIDLQTMGELRKEAQAMKGAAAKTHVERGIGGLTIDGKPLAADGSNGFLAPSDKEAEKLREQKAGIDSVNQFVNQMSRGIDEHGGASKFLQSPEYQSMIANKEALKFALHQAYGVEGFRPGIFEELDKALGSTDPTSFLRSAVPGLKTARDAVNANFTNKLRVMDERFKGEYKPEDTSSPPAPGDTVDDKQLKIILGDRKDDPGAVFDPVTGKYEPKIAGMYHVDPDFKGDAPLAETRSVIAVGQQYPNLGAGQAALLRINAEQLKSPDQVVAKHAAAVLDAATRADNSDVRDYAQQLLTDNIGTSVPLPTEQTSTASGPGRTTYTGAQSTASPATPQAPPEWVLPRR